MMLHCFLLHKSIQRGAQHTRRPHGASRRPHGASRRLLHTGKTVTHKLIEPHIVEGKMKTGEEIALEIDQTLTQDATGTVVMLHLESMNLDRVKTEVSAQYVDHNLIQADFRNPDDHLYLWSACKKFGVWYSRAGNGVSHPVHMERFGIPGKTLLGSDSHTCAAGSLGMLAIGAGGLEVAAAMAGEPFWIRMPKVLGVKLEGTMPDWVSAKDIILEMLRRHTVSGGKGKVVEYYGPGLEQLTAMDRHVIANMGAELGALTTVFPSDERVKEFLNIQLRGDDFQEILPDENAKYDEHDTINLSNLEPLIALPSSPDKVVPVREVEGKVIFQSYIGSSANPGFRDFAVPALMVEGKTIPPQVSFDIAPTSRQILENLTSMSYLSKLLAAGARVHQAGCNGCIGMGQAPATHKISLRTVPRNFPGRSGTKEDMVYLCSPETATASAITGKITDPRNLRMPYSKFKEPPKIKINVQMLEPPAPSDEKVEVIKGPNIVPLPKLEELAPNIYAPVMIKVGDNISTDEIMPAGSTVLPYRSNIPGISQFVFWHLDENFYNRALELKDTTGSLIVGGSNYGQGSSREHAALAPRYLGIRAVLAKDFARIHRSNLINFGILPLVFSASSDYDRISQGDNIQIENIREAVGSGSQEVIAFNKTTHENYPLTINLSQRERDIILVGGATKYIAKKRGFQ